ncbi:MAG: hypothetical protein PHN82_09650 [bacterium]|nr:hypothetical protein [bacterium]
MKNIWTVFILLVALYPVPGARAVEYGYYEYVADGILNAISGADSHPLWAVGNNGLILHYDGSRWVPERSGTLVDLTGVWALDGDRVWAMGEGWFFYRDAGRWIPIGRVPGVQQVQFFPSGEAIVMKDATMYHYPGTGKDLYEIPTPVKGRIMRFSALGAEHFWLLSSDAGDRYISYYHGGEIDEIKVDGAGMDILDMFASDDKNVWLVSMTAFTPSIAAYSIMYYDGAAWQKTGVTGIRRLRRGMGSGVYGIGSGGVFNIEEEQVTPVESSLGEIGDIHAGEGNQYWALEANAIRHYTDWPTHILPVGVKVAGGWGAASPFSGVSLSVSACVQPTSFPFDLYILVRTPDRKIYSILPGNDIARGVFPYARGIPLVESQMIQEVFRDDSERYLPEKEAYQVGIGLMREGVPFDIGDMLGAYVGTLADRRPRPYPGN